MPNAPFKIGTEANPKGYICNSSPVMTGGTMATATLVEPRPDDRQEPGQETRQETGSTELTSGAPSLGMTINQPVVCYRIASQMDARGGGSCQDGPRPPHEVSVGPAK